MEKDNEPIEEDYYLKYPEESRQEEAKADVIDEFYRRMQAELEREPINRARYLIALDSIYQDLKSKPSSHEL